MASTIDAMAGVLVAELKRLASLDAHDPERIASECMRSKAINDTVKTACALGSLHLQSQMMRMGKDTDVFQPGALFADRQEHAWQKPDGRRLNAGEAVSDGGRTVINEHGEFECDDGLDDFTGSVEGNGKADSNREPDGENPYKCDTTNPDDVRRYAAERKRKSREKAKEAVG